MIKESGSCQKSMSSILDNLGVDKDDFQWFHLALCNGMDTNLFYDKYEADVNIAKNIDEACIGCPVIKMCYESGIENNEHGIWGGVYLNSGSVDKTRNTHKTKEVWKKLKVLHG
jgi:hypothetical protein